MPDNVIGFNQNLVRDNPRMEWTIMAETVRLGYYVPRFPQNPYGIDRINILSSIMVCLKGIFMVHNTRGQ